VVRILLLETFIFAGIILILRAPLLLLLLVPVLTLLSNIFQDSGKVFVPFFTLVFSTPVAFLSSIRVRRAFLSIFNLFPFVVVLVSSIVSLFAAVIIMIIVIVIILIVIVEFVEWLSDLWFWTGVGVDGVVVAGGRLDLILEYFEHPLDLTDLQDFILSLEGETFAADSTITDLDVGIDLILGTSFNDDLDNI
jgi:hypothetical protein